MSEWSTMDMNGGPWQGLSQDENFQLGIEQGLEVAIALSMDRMRQHLGDLRHFLTHWQPNLAENIEARTKVNSLGLTLWYSITAAGQLIALLQPHISTREFTNEWVEINDAYELLSSWDLYMSFGWEVE